MRILLVEDNKAVRDSLSEFIQGLGHSVMESSDGKAALSLLMKEKIDLVLSDIRMPKMDGHELLRQIKSSNTLKDIEVLLFTGHGDVKSAVRAMREGAYDYLLKPINIKELDAIIHRIGEYLHLKEENKKLTENFNKEVKKATQNINEELIAVRKAFAEQIGTMDIGIYSKVMKDLFTTAEKLHQNPNIHVLIEGETGTGKELVARWIHYGKGDVTTPFIDLNCAAISSNLFESELFGYIAGAFTGGHPRGQKGKLEIAQNGTLFLDEITEMAIEHQAKLLRVLQERTYYKVGGVEKLSTNSRFIGATNQNVAQKVKEGVFREDLFYRLNIGYIHIPPLRERREEILPLAQLFLESLIRQKKTRFRKISDGAAKMLEDYPWPGNVRELRNMIERILLYWNDEEIQCEHLESCFQKTPIPLQFGQPAQIFDITNIPLPNHNIDLNKISLDIVKKAYEKHGENQTKTAHYLGVSVRVLHTYLKRLQKQES